MPFHPLGRLLAVALLSATAQAALAQDPTPPTADSPSSGANRVFDSARQSLLQVRTLVKQSARQSSIGSAFVIGADGLAVTNYHVVSQFVLEPNTYRLEYVGTRGEAGALRLLAIDVANDLAVVALDETPPAHLAFDPRALSGALRKGERLYSMGNPLDLGFTIVEGTYNGAVERSYSERMHFTGAINPGMSGGPVANSEGRVVGVNVAKRLDGELVSFLVPARYALALLDRARAEPPLDPATARDEIGRQLLARQQHLYGALQQDGFEEVQAGPYRAPESRLAWFHCWASTNADEKPRPRLWIRTTQCRADTGLFIAEDLGTGAIELSHSYIDGVDLNAFQFANALSAHFSGGGRHGFWNQERFTSPRCQDAFVSAAERPGAPIVRASWCAWAYRDFKGLYNVSLSVVTQDRSTEALVARVDMEGVAYATALTVGRAFLDTLGAAP